jgi:putative ABC transport system permease protein
MKPPKFAERLLAWSVPEDDRLFMLGDCAEEHAAIASARGPAAANRWYRTQVLRSVARNLMRRNRRAPSPRKDPIVTTLWQDIRYALRQLRRSPGFAVPAIITLALGIAAAAAVFTVVNRVVLRPLPYPEPERLIRLWDRNETAGLTYFSVSPANYFAWQQHSRTIQAMGAYREDGFTIATADGGERIDGARVTWSMFDVLRVPPASGRPIQAADDHPGAANVVVLSEALAERLNQAPGRSITIDGKSHLVVGVLPRSFHFPQQPQVQLLVPYALDSATPEATAHFLRVLARLRPDAAVDQARVEFATMAAALESAAPQYNRGWTVAVRPLHEAIVGDVQQPLYLLFGAALLLLVITCANVAGLLLARGASREGELAVRAALGAGSGRLARQLVTESLVLSAIGGVTGLALSRVGLDALLAINPDVLPRASEIGVDVRVVAFVAIVCALTGLFFGTVPSLLRTGAQGLRDGLAGSGRTPGARAPRLRRLLVASEIAVALALTTGAALLVANLRGLQQVDPGFDTENVLTMELRPPAGTYGDPKSRVRLIRQIVDALRQLPGVKAAGGAHRLPLDGNSAIPLVLAGQASRSTTPPSINYRAIAGDYFAALGMDIVKGRSFSDVEMWENGGAVIVNQAAVERYFGTLDPLTQRLMGPQNRELQVVGVVQNVREDALDQPAAPAMYLPYGGAPAPAMVLLVSSTTPPSGLARGAQYAVQQIDPSLAVAKIRPLRQFMGDVVAAPRFNATLLATFACLALALAAVGIYGVTAYSVAERAPEIGVRVALGARPADIFRAVVVPGLALAAIGTAAGVLGAIAIARLLGGAILGVNANQPAIFLTASVVLFTISALASVLPARRAMQIDPILALRVER